MARRVTPASDVNVSVTTITNLGTSAAAGVVSGAWCSILSGQPGASNAVEGECAPSRSQLIAGRNRCKAVAGRSCALVGTKAQRDDERSDEMTRSDDPRRPGEETPPASIDESGNAVRPDRFGRTGGAWRRMDGLHIDRTFQGCRCAARGWPHRPAMEWGRAIGKPIGRYAWSMVSHVSVYERRCTLGCWGDWL